MNRALIVEPDNYQDLTQELEEVGVEYDIAEHDEASELFSLVNYDAVVGPEDEELYVRTVSDEVPFLIYNDIYGSAVATDTLVGESGFDARRVAAYMGVEGFESYTKNLSDVVESHDDMSLFLDMLEHDVKNDVHVAQAYCDLMDVEPGQEDRAELVDERLRSINRLMDTVETVRSLEDAQTEDIHLSTVFDQLDSSYKTMAAEEDFELDITLEQDITVSAGPLLNDMYAQMIENSINHSEGSQIQVTAEDRENPVVIFEDDGRGIPDDIRDNLFQKGVKGKKTGNTGIGTTLIDKIADRYDIEVDMGQSDLGGAQFTLHHQPGTE